MLAPDSGTSKYIDPPRSLDEMVARIGSRLAGAFSALLAGLPGAPHRPQELARALNINKDLSSRILKAVENKDPIAIAHAIPGPDPLRRLIRAGARRQVDREVVRAAEQAVDEFESLIRNVAGDRGGLDTIISAWLPEVREKAELLSKQAVFKGMSQIRGLSAEVDFVTRFVHPATSGHKRDYVLLSGLRSLRRLRPGAVVALNYFGLHPAAGSGRRLTMDGNAADHEHDYILEPFCSSPRPHFAISEDRAVTSQILSEDEVGLKSATDVTWAHMQRSSEIRGVFSTVNVPTRKGIYDLFIHPDVEPRVEPALEIHDTTEQGIARFGDPARAADLLDLRANIDFLGAGASRFRCSEIPRYMDMIEFVCRKMGWNASEFLGYRCSIDYPLYGSQITLAFDPSLETLGKRIR